MFMIIDNESSYTSHSPDTANTKWWLTPEEKELAIRRVPVASDDTTFSKKQFVAVFKDYQNAFYTLIYISVLVCISSYSTFLPTIIRDMGVSSLKAQLLTIPPYIVACCCLFVCVNPFALCCDGSSLFQGCSLVLGSYPTTWIPCCFMLSGYYYRICVLTRW